MAKAVRMWEDDDGFVQYAERDGGKLFWRERSLYRSTWSPWKQAPMKAPSWYRLLPGPYRVRLPEGE